MAYATVDPAKYSDPSSHAQAVLQLLARLTKKHSIAQMVSVHARLEIPPQW